MSERHAFLVDWPKGFVSPEQAPGLSDADLGQAAAAASQRNVWSPLAKAVFEEVVRRWEAGLEDPADHEPCDAEMHTLDYFRGHEDIDSYWMRCDLIGPHEEHENSHTGAKWRDAE